MPKHPKKASATPVVPITQFFSRKSRIENGFSSPSVSQLPPTQSENSKPRNTSASRRRGISGFLNSSNSSLSMTSGVCLDATRVSTSTDRKIMDPVEIIRTPNNKLSTRHKSVFDSDSDAELPAPAVYVLRPPPGTPSTPATHGPLLLPLRATENLTNASQTRSKGRQRLLSPTPESETIPTSQPDERDIAPHHTRRQVPRLERSSPRRMDRWFTGTALPADTLSIDSYDGSRSDFDMTPLENDSLATPSPRTLPDVLSPDTKTAQIIANIKSKAYTESLHNRPETPIREFRDELSDGSDDDLLPESPMQKSSKKYTSPTTNKRSPTSCNLRSQDFVSLSTKNRSASASSSHTLLASPIPSSSAKRLQKEKIKAPNPIDDLLREKKRLDVLGKGCEALRQAEASLADRDAIMLAIGDDDLTNEDAARKYVVEYKQKTLKSSSPTIYSESEDELKDDERERLLGKKHAKEVSRLLQSDSVHQEKEKMIEKAIGTPFWSLNEDMDSLMEIDDMILPLPSTSIPQLAALQGALERQDLVQAALLIDLSLDHINSSDYSSIIPYLCKLALSMNETILSNSAFRCLIRVWEMSDSPIPGITLTCILSTLAQLGARPSVFYEMGWTMNTKRAIISPEIRHAVLYRLIALVAGSARSQRILKEEISDILMSLVLIANESSIPHVLQCDVVLTIDELCRSLALGEIISSYEALICTKVLKYVSALEPVNKACIAAFFGSGVGRTKRISRWIAHGILTDRQTLTSECYSELPPLSPLMEELTCIRSDDETQAYGKFEQHAKTDFADMMFYVEILSIAVTNIEGYVAAELTVPKPSITQHPTISSEPPLKAIQLAAENLHSEISDIRATHLDRSRTKAALKEFSLRLHYQRQAAVQSAGTLHTYFTKKPRSALP